jgi:hypothetical protein
MTRLIKSSIPFRENKYAGEIRQAVDLNGAGERSRTPDIFITSEALYQLSYAGLLPLQARRPILEK